MLAFHASTESAIPNHRLQHFAAGDEMLQHLPHPGAQIELLDFRAGSRAGSEPPSPRLVSDVEGSLGSAPGGPMLAQLRRHGSQQSVRSPRIRPFFMTPPDVLMSDARSAARSAWDPNLVAALVRSMAFSPSRLMEPAPL